MPQTCHALFCSPFAYFLGLEFSIQPLLHFTSDPWEHASTVSPKTHQISITHLLVGSYGEILLSMYHVLFEFSWNNMLLLCLKTIKVVFYLLSENFTAFPLQMELIMPSKIFQGICSYAILFSKMITENCFWRGHSMCQLYVSFQPSCKQFKDRNCVYLAWHLQHLA